MKRAACLLAALASAALLGAEPTPGRAVPGHEVSLSWGGLGSPYLYPVNEAAYRGENILLDNLVLGIDLRSGGTLYFVSRMLDADLYAAYRMPIWGDAVSVSAGGGVAATLRLSNDVRATGLSNGVTGLAMLEGQLAIGPVTARLPFKLRIYLDGVVGSAALDAAFRWWMLGIFLKTEMSLGVLYAYPVPEWRWNNYAGIRVYLGGDAAQAS